MDSLNPKLSRVGIVIVDQYLTASPMRRVMTQFLSKLRGVGGNCWVVEVGMDADDYDDGLYYPLNNTTIGSVNLGQKLDELENLPLDFNMRLDRLKYLTSTMARHAQLARGTQYDRGYYPGRSLEKALKHRDIESVLAIMGFDRIDLRRRIETLDDEAQRSALHSLAQMLFYQERGLGDQFYGMTLDILKSLLETGLPSKMPE